MELNIIRLLRSNPILYQYLKYHSYWYKELVRNPEIINELEKEMKKEYKMTIEDRIKKINDRMDFIASFLEVLK